MKQSLHARYEFLDETRSRSETRVRLNHFSPRAESAALALAGALANISTASLYRVSLLYRVELDPYEPPPAPLQFRTRIGIRSQSDAFHAILPVTVERAAEVVDFLKQNDFCTRTGESFSDEFRIEETTPNWRSVEWGGSNKRFVVVLDEQLWRDLLITSMTLNSASTMSASLAGAILRREVYEMLKGVDLEEILERLDQIIALLEARAQNDASFFEQFDDVEELLNLIISLI